MEIEIKRIYDVYSADDGMRVLVDRLWPRGIKKSETIIDSWQKDLAPSTELRKWFDHDPGKWNDFKNKYLTELEDKKEKINLLLRSCTVSKITFLYAAKSRDYNQAVVLKEYIEKNIQEKKYRRVK